MRFGLSLLLLLSFQWSFGQERYPFDSTLFKNINYRLIGPFRGGRASGVCGDYKDKQVFYMGTTGGGVWKTKDAGNTWMNISDKFFGGSIGDIQVSPSDPLKIYVGTGENTLRGNVSEGKGLWKTTDGGRTWKYMGLERSGHITKIIIHPKNDEILYCAALGHLFGPNKERGIYKSMDGGESWERILFMNENAGAADMVMDPANPDILYASTWNVRRTSYGFSSGGEGSALWKSPDGGKTWENLSAKPGLPKEMLGIIRMAIAPSNPDKIYALVEAKTGGLYKSSDAGEHWERINDESKIRQRAWYFSKVNVDPVNENIVYVCNVEFHRSRDGGRTFETVHTPHGDHHNLWIDPADGQRMIVADDGGAQISLNGGESWSTYMNQPTAQFYRVSTDNHFPFRILGCQQDNTSLRILSRTYDGSIGRNDWEPSAGFESGYLVANPENPEIVYGGNYGGYLSRFNHETRENRNISVWPVSPIGEGADVQKFRFNWNFPILFSPHNPKRLYAAANHLFVTENEGRSWQMISPDLTTNDKSRQIASGGEITKDNTTVEYYCTIFALGESPVRENVLWCGSDDGLVHVSENGGGHWENVTPLQLPEWSMINCIEPSRFDAGTCYIAATRYKLDDTEPYLYRTRNYGRTWQRIVKGIRSEDFTRCIRQDENGILYCGTEHGMYISFDDGSSWLPFQLNLPEVPVTDLAVKNNSLVIATQGRSFWVLDHLNKILQMESFEKDFRDFYFFKPAASYRMKGWKNEGTVWTEGMNPDNAVIFDFWANEIQDTSKIELKIFTEKNELLKMISNFGEEKDKNIKLEKGMNRLLWNMKIKGVDKIDGMIMWNGNVNDFKVAPGKYIAELKVDGEKQKQEFEILKDPNYLTTEKEYQEQFEFLRSIRDKFDETQQCIKDIRNLRSQINLLSSKLGDNYPEELKILGKDILDKSEKIENNLVQTKAKSGQDVLNYPIKLNDKLVGIFHAANQEVAPSKQSKEAFGDVSQLIDKELNAFQHLIKNDLALYNQLIRDKRIDFIQLKKKED